MSPLVLGVEVPHGMVRLLARVIGVGVETAVLLVQEVLGRNLHDLARWRVMAASPALLTRAARSVARKGWLDPVTRESGAA
jgi:transposase